MHKRTTSTSTEDLHIRVADRWEDIAGPWREIERDGNCYPFQTLAWVSTLLDTVGLGRGCTPRLVLVTDGTARPLMLIPLVLTRRHGMQILEFVDFRVSDYNAPIIDRVFAESLSTSGFLDLWGTIQALIGPFDILRIEKIPADIEGAPNPFLQLSCVPSEQAWQAILEDGSQPYPATRSKSMLSTLGRKRRRMAKLGRVSFEVAATAEEAEQVAATMIRMKSLRYRETGVSDLFGDSSYADFYKLLAHRYWADLCHLSTLKLDGKPVSVLLGTNFRGRLCYLMPSFEDGEFASCSPGQQHLLDLIKWCGANGNRILDFTWGNEDYKRVWANRCVTLYTYTCANTTRGRIWSRGSKIATGFYRAMKVQLRKNPKRLAYAKGLRRLLRNIAAVRPSLDNDLPRGDRTSSIGLKSHPRQTEQRFANTAPDKTDSTPT